MPKKKCRKRNIQPIISTSVKPFDIISIDIIDPLLLSDNGNKYILRMLDDLRKFSQTVPISNHEAIINSRQLKFKESCEKKNVKKYYIN